MIIAFVIWSIVTMIFVGIGISCIRSKEAVGFFTFTKPPIVEDVKKYNKAVAKLWFVTAVVFEIIGIPFLFLEQNSPLFIVIMFAVIIWVIVLIVAYLKIEMKYKSRKVCNN